MAVGLLSTLSEDPGDDVQRRFAYQDAYGIILLLGMIESQELGTAVYFEHHDDLLVERGDGKYVAVQVKTKDIPAPAKATEPAIIASISRFIDLEIRHPGEMHAFKIVSSSGFVNDRSSNDLAEVLSVVTDLRPERLVSDTRTKRLCKKLIPPADAVVAHSVLQRIELVPDAPGLNDIEDRLSRQLGDLDLCRLALPYQIRLAVRELVALGIRAATYRPSGPNYDAIAVLKGNGAVNEAIIAEKRVDRDMVAAIIEECLQAPMPTDMGISSLTELDNRKLRTKMAKAKVPARAIDQVTSCAEHARMQLQVQKQRLGRTEARGRYARLRAIVHSEFEDLLEGALQASLTSGQPLYAHIRDGIRRLPQTRPDLSGTDGEELLGIAGVLSDECKLWWTEDRSLPADAE
jgi:hypothetical protein